MTRKQVLSLLLTFVMVLSMLPGRTIAMAADETTGSVVEQQEAAAETENDAALSENPEDTAAETEEAAALTENPEDTAAETEEEAVLTENPEDTAAETEDETVLPENSDEAEEEKEAGDVEQAANPEEAAYTVTFEVNGGSEVEEQQVKEGETAEEPENPTKEGFTFGGWFEDGTCVVAFDFATPITGDVKVYAKWTEIKPDHPAFNDAKTVNGVAVTVSAPEGVFPKGSYLSVESVPVSAQSMVDEAVENERDADANVAVSYTFDIKVLDTEDNEIQPADAQSVKVSFGLAEAKDDNLEAQVYHISDEGNAEALDTSVNGDAVEAVTDGFSFYTVEFTYGTMTYVLPGGSEVKLSDVLSYVGLSGEVTAASGSNDELFSITQESGEWMIHSHQPFNTEEKLSVTINGIVYEIIVTDTNVSGTIYASSLADNDNLVLTGDTTLVMDVNKSLKSISGAYALTIQGSNTLEVNNNAGHAISVKSLTSAAFLRLISSKYALNIEQNINTSGGLFIISDGVGAYSKNGSITISGKSTISSGENAIYSPKGSISVNGDLTAETTSSSHFCIAAHGTLTLEGGTINVTSVTNATRVRGDITLGGNVTITGLTGGAINSIEGSVIIKNGSTVKAGAKYGIYAGQNVKMEGGTLTVTGTGSFGIEAGNGNITLNGTVNVNAAQAAIYSPKGSISVNGDLTAETTNGKYICVVGNNGVTLTGGTVSISSKTVAVRTAGDIELSGNITVSSADSAAVNTLDGGNILIKNGSTIKATGKYGLYAAGGITVEGGTVNAQGSSNAVYSNTGTITIHSPLAITTPDGGRVSGKTIVGADGKTATEVVIQNRPLPDGCTVSIANGAGAEVGDVLTLKFSDDFPFSGRSFQWQKNVSGTWEDIPGETTAVYTAKAADQGRAFRVRVTVAGYSGEKFSSGCTILVKPALGGSVTYNGSAYVGREVISYRDAELNAIYYNAPAAFNYQWEISNNGSTGWTEIDGATTDRYTPVASDDGKYLRVYVTVAGYTGSVYGSVLKVSKAPKADNDNIPVTPELTTASPYTTVTITNAKASQEYVFNYTGLPPSDWNGAQSPAADGTLTLNVESGKLVRVYTRYKETETTKAGTLIRHSSIHTDAYTELQGVDFDKNELKVLPGSNEELIFVPNPDSFVWGARPVTWTFDNRYVQLFKDAGGLQPITSGDSVNGLTKVYVRWRGQTPETIITASAQIGTDRYIAHCSAEVSDNTGLFALRHLDFGGEKIENPGTNSAIGFKIIPGNASVGMVTFEKTSGPASTLGLTVRSIESATGTLDVHVPAGAKEGTYVYSVKVNSADTPEPSTLTITVLSNEVTVTFDANGGSGNMSPKTMWLGTWYILPECGFIAPEGREFVRWDKGDPGDYITVGENTKITAQWKLHVHDLILVPAFEATCEWDGNKEYYICDGCGKWYEDATGSTEITDHNSVVIPATGHTPGTAVKEYEIDATCTEAGGYDEVVYCTVCHAEISRTHTAIPATGHTLTLVPAKAATCTEDGNKEYYECSVCGDLFEDSAGTKEITDYYDVIIDALDHDWGDWIQTKAPTATEEGEETRTCSRCSEKETRSIAKLNVTDDKAIVNGGSGGSAHSSSGGTAAATASAPTSIRYDVITGHGQAWAKGSGVPLAFTARRSAEDEKTFSLFRGVTIDGVTLDNAHHMATAGSLNLSLSSTYLETLSEGTHTIRILFADGHAEGQFTVLSATAPANMTRVIPPQTSDAGVPLIYGFGAVLLLALMRLFREAFDKKGRSA